MVTNLATTKRNHGGWGVISCIGEIVTGKALPGDLDGSRGGTSGESTQIAADG